jgi:ABC-type sugar transport system permease subunit
MLISNFHDMYVNVLNIKMLNTQNYVIVSNIFVQVWKIALYQKTMFLIPLNCKYND